MGLRALSATALALLALATVGAASSAAARTWLSPVDLSANWRGPVAWTPQVAIDSEGDAVAVWTLENGGKGIVQSASRPAGGAWSTPVDLDTVRSYSQPCPQVAVDSDGNAVAVWVGTEGIRSARRRAGSAWSTPVTISARWRTASDPQVAIDSKGNALVVWTRHGRIESASRRAARAWSAPVDIAAAGPFPPRVAIDSKGDAVVVWTLEDGGVQSASRPAGGAWSAPVTLSATASRLANPQVAVDSKGDAVVVWTLEDGGVQSASRPAGGAWSAPVTLSATAQRLTNPQVAVDPKGDAVAVWSLFDSPNGFTVKSAQRLAGGAWSAPVSLPAAGDFSDPHARLSIDSQGDAVAVWRGPDGIQSARRPAGGAWSTAVSLFGRGHDPEVAVNPRGDAVAVWLRGGEYGVVLRAASYEAAARLQRARAYAAPAAHPEGTTVLVRLRCRGHGSCRGAVKLYFEHELIAKRHFALAAHRSRTLGVKLNRRGRELVHNTHRHRLKLELSGRGVKNRTEVLKGL